MKILFLFLCFTLPFAATAETVKKWVDEKGIVHYGDKKAAATVKDAKTLKIEDTFDAKAYQEGLQRHRETEALVKEYEDERAQQEKVDDEEKAADNAAQNKRLTPGETLAQPRYRSRPNPIGRPLPGSKPGQGNNSRPVTLPARKPR